MSESPRVMITGIGLVTPLGTDRETSWQGLLSGERAVSALPSDEPFWPAATFGARRLDSARAVEDGISRDEDLRQELEFLLQEPNIRMACSAALEAVEHAGLDLSEVNLNRSACVIGTSKGGTHSWHQLWSHDRVLAEQSQSCGDLREVAEQFERKRHENPGALWLRMAPHGPASVVASILNLRGGALAPITACATGLSSIMRGADLIRHGECDVVLAGSSDASLTPAVIASFRKLGVLAKGDCDPKELVKPFDRNRNGFAIGEGSGIVVLESEAHAEARGAKPMSEWLTGGMASEATGLTQLQQQPEALTWLIGDVLRRSGLSPADIDYISLHGTATKANDLAETRAIKVAFGNHAYDLAASSLKGAIGHLLGAAGSVEFAATLLAMRDGQLPPTMNLTDPDDECDLEYVAGESQCREVRHAMKLSLGFGGHLVAGVVRAV